MVTAEQTAQVTLPKAVMDGIKRAAQRSGQSVQQWIADTVKDGIAEEQKTYDFFRVRRERATGEGFRLFLERVPDNPPDPWDQWDDPELAGWAASQVKPYGNL